MPAVPDSGVFNPETFKSVGLALGTVSMLGGAALFLLREPIRKWLFEKEMEAAAERQRTVEEHTREIAGLKVRVGVVEDSVSGIAGAVATLKDMARSLREIKDDIKAMRQDHADTRDDVADTKERVARIEGVLGERPERRKHTRRSDVERRAPEDGAEGEETP